MHKTGSRAPLGEGKQDGEGDGRNGVGGDGDKARASADRDKARAGADREKARAGADREKARAGADRPWLPFWHDSQLSANLRAMDKLKRAFPNARLKVASSAGMALLLSRREDADRLSASRQAITSSQQLLTHGNRALEAQPRPTAPLEK